MVGVGRHISSICNLNAWDPQRCVLSTLLFYLYTQDCVSTNSSNTTVKSANNMVGHISHHDEQMYTEEVDNLSHWLTTYCWMSAKPRNWLWAWREDCRGVTLHWGSMDHLWIGCTALSISLRICHGPNILTYYHLRQLRKFRTSVKIVRTIYQGKYKRMFFIMSYYYFTALRNSYFALQCSLYEHVTNKNYWISWSRNKENRLR